MYDGYNQSNPLQITQNGTSTISIPQNYEGLDEVHYNVNVPPPTVISPVTSNGYYKFDGNTLISGTDQDFNLNINVNTGIDIIIKKIVLYNNDTDATVKNYNGTFSSKYLYKTEISNLSLNNLQNNSYINIPKWGSSNQKYYRRYLIMFNDDGYIGFFYIVGYDVTDLWVYNRTGSVLKYYLINVTSLNNYTPTTCYCNCYDNDNNLIFKFFNNSPKSEGSSSSPSYHYVTGINLYNLYYIKDLNLTVG